MTERDLIGRLDARLEKVDADAHMARADTLMEQIREEMRLSREEHQDLSDLARIASSTS